MTPTRLTFLAFAALLLTACGGGGGASGTSAPVTTPTPPVVTPPVTPPVVMPPVVAAPPYTLSPAVISVDSVSGFQTLVSLTATQTTTYTGTAYLKVVPDAPVIDPAIAITARANGSFGVAVKTLASAKPGQYAGNITVNVCADAACASHLPGSPFLLPYAIHVFSPDGGVIPYNLSPLAALTGAPDWETFQGNAQHTGYVAVTLNSAQFTARWKWETAALAGDQYSVSALVTGGGRIYLAAAAGALLDKPGSALTAYNESDGSQAWTHVFQDLGYKWPRPPAYSGGKVFAATGAQDDTWMYALNGADGKQLFKSTMGSQWDNYLAPTVFNGTVYSEGTHFGGMYAFATATGATKFVIPLSQFTGWTPAVDAQGLYVYDSNNLKVLDPANGAVRATIADPSSSHLGATSEGAPVIGAVGTVFSGNMNTPRSTAVTAFDTLAKTVRWSAPGAYAGNPAYADGLLFAANVATGTLDVRKEADGALAWSWAAPSADQAFIGDVLLTKNLVFLSTIGTTYAIDRTTHLAVWSYQAGGKLALSANGILYIKSSTTIVAINLH